MRKTYTITFLLFLLFASGSIYLSSSKSSIQGKALANQNEAGQNVTAQEETPQKEAAQNELIQNLGGPARIAEAMAFDRERRLNPVSGEIPQNTLLEAYEALRTRGFFRDEPAYLQANRSAEYSWEQVNDFLPSMAITRLVVDPSNPSHFYFCTGEGWFNADAVRGAGVWRSMDAGTSWDRLPSTDSTIFYYCQDMLIHPTSGDIYVATRTGGLQRSQDGGASWTKVLGAGEGAGTNRCADIEVTADGELFVGMGIFDTDGLYFSPSGDAGSWVEQGNGFPTSGIYRIQIATAKSNANVAYATCINSGDLKVTGIYRTDDKGANWTQLSDPGGDKELARTQGWYDLVLEVDPWNEDVVVAGGLNIWRTQNGGADWQQLTAGRPDSALIRYVHVDQHEAVFVSSDTVYFGNDGGIWKCDNFTDPDPIIYNRNLGYNVTQFYSAAIHPDAGSNVVIGGTQDNGSLMSILDGGESKFKVLSGGDGAFSAFNQDNPMVLYTGMQLNRIFRFDNGGFEIPDTITNPYIDNSNVLFINPFELDPNDPEILYMASNRGLQRLDSASTALPESWEKATRNFGTITAIGIAQDVPNLVFIGRNSSNGEIYRIDDAHQTDNFYEPIGIDPNNQLPDAPLGGGSLNVSSISVDPNDANHLLVSYSNYGVSSLFESKNALAFSPTWSFVEGDLPDLPVNWALIHPHNPAVAYIATDLGVFYTNLLDSANTNWLPCSTFPAVRTDMIRWRESDDMLVAGTHARGIFTAKLDPDGLSNDLLWTERGPINVGGRTRTIVVDPNDPSGETVWAGSVAGGLWKTNSINALGIGTPSVLQELTVFPNPFGADGVNIAMDITQPGEYDLRLFDLDGQQVAELFAGSLPTGNHTFNWKAGARAAGLYLAVLEHRSTGQRQVSKIYYSQGR